MPTGLDQTRRFHLNPTLMVPVPGAAGRGTVTWNKPLRQAVLAAGVYALGGDILGQPGDPGEASCRPGSPPYRLPAAHRRPLAWLPPRDSRPRSVPPVRRHPCRPATPSFDRAWTDTARGLAPIARAQEKVPMARRKKRSISVGRVRSPADSGSGTARLPSPPGPLPIGHLIRRRWVHPTEPSCRRGEYPLRRREKGVITRRLERRAREDQKPVLRAGYCGLGIR